jgi:hypothetical protein
MVKPMSANIQRCKRCTTEKATTDFYFHKKSGYDSTCKTCRIQQEHNRYFADPVAARAKMKAHRLANYETIIAKEQAVTAKLKAQLLDGLGRVCACCGEMNTKFLTLDHIHNDGHEHRKRRSSTLSRWRDVIAEGFPRDRYQILCFNCNAGRAINGGVCPHKE